ncbi:MAG: aminotransferase class I/II-fold pyridoxal phosphate-dependent enzyme, partial [Thermoplasmata archaeon]
MLQFDTGKWIISHPGKYDLSQSGMGGRINLEKYFKFSSMVDESVLKETIALLHNEDSENVIITHGATEALFLTLYHLYVNGHRDYITYKPEYEPLIKDPPALGMREKEGDVFVFSNTNNPTGTEIEYPKNYRAYVVDDTFLQFYRNLDSVKYPENTYRINTFTKFYGGDEVRVGWIVAPDKKEAAEINSLKGIFTEQVSRYNISVANAILKDQDEILRFVRNAMNKNLTYIKNNMGKLKFYRNLEPLTGTVTFIDYSSYIERDPVSVSEYLYKNLISLVPGTIFGVEGPYLRVCYSREDFTNSFERFKDALNLIS